MSQFKIEKGIPCPKTMHKYPFPDMEVGDSFVFNPNDAGNVNSATTAYTKKNPGVKFVVRKQSDTQSRVWRVS